MQTTKLEAYPRTIPRYKTMGMLLGLMLFICMGFTACNQPTPSVSAPARTLPSSSNLTIQNNSPKATDFVSLLAQLRAAGASVVDMGKTSSLPLVVAGRVLHIGGELDGERVEVYQYATAAGATADASRISPNACMITLQGKQVDIVWEMPPHLYKSGRIIVVYLGISPTIEKMLTDILGPQFAGV